MRLFAGYLIPAIVLFIGAAALTGHAQNKDVEIPFADAELFVFVYRCEVPVDVDQMPQLVK